MNGYNWNTYYNVDKENKRKRKWSSTVWHWQVLRVIWCHHDVAKLYICAQMGHINFHMHFHETIIGCKVRNKYSLYCILMFINVNYLQFSFLFII